MQLLVDPRKEADGGVRQGIAECLRLGGLLSPIPAAFLRKPVVAAYAPLLARVVGGKLVLEVEERVGEEGGLVASNHVDVGGADVVGIHERHGTGNHAAPVAALGDIMGVAEFQHEFVARFGILGKGEAAFGDAGGESEVWMGGGDDVERGSGGGCKEG